jgi:hypothetical protein
LVLLRGRLALAAFNLNVVADREINTEMLEYFDGEAYRGRLVVRHVELAGGLRFRTR